MIYIKKINELGYHFFIPESSFKQYEAIYASNQSIIDKIFLLLTINPGFMVEASTDENKIKEQTKDEMYRQLENKIKHNKKIELIGFYFNSKPSRYQISGGVVYPDVSDFLVLLHLNTMIYFINKLYSPGCLIKIGCEINFFQTFANIRSNEALRMQHTLWNFNRICETLLASTGQVFLFDVLNEIKPFEKSFYSKIEEEIYTFLKKPDSLSEVERSTQYYIDYVLDTKKFPNQETAWNFAFTHSLESIGYQNATESMFDAPDGLFENFSNCLFVQTRFFKNSIIENRNENKKRFVYCSILPGAETMSFNAITLRTNDNLWKQINYSDVAKYSYKPFYVQDINYPFCYTEASNIG